MTALDSSPLNPNFLSGAGFEFQIIRAPDLSFYVQKINIPSISINPTQSDNPFVKIPESGDHIDYDILSVTFKVDEYMNNWLSMHSWMRGLGFPVSFDEYRELKGGSKVLQRSIKSELKLFVLTSHRNPKLEFTFHDAFPIHLSGLDFESTSTDVDYIESTVSFAYSYYSIYLGPF